MKKKISLLMCMLAAVFTLAGCSNNETGVEYDQAAMEEATEFLIAYCSSVDDATIEQWKSLTDEQLNYQLMQSGYPFTAESFLSSMDAWKAGVEECGAYIGHGDLTYEAGNSELSITTTAEFEDRQADLEIIYETDLRGNLQLDSLTVSGKYSMGEILQKAGLNTLLGMGTVFVVLIIISVIISLLKYIPKLQAAFTKKAEPQQVAPASVSETPAAEVAEEVVVEETQEDDTELVAVIAAAIAASEGTSTDGFVVRSIRRRRSNKWN